MRFPCKQKGFTLIEVAIVLVVMTLLLGGIIVGGTAVMENARTASLISQIKDLAAASRDFKSRYGYFPGDLPNAGTLITGATCSGAGDGIVNSEPESQCALQHLVRVGMLSKVEFSGGNYRIQHPFGGGEVSLWHIPSTAPSYPNENAIRVTNLPCRIALRIDDKLDNASTTPLASGAVTSDNGSGCVPGGANDPLGILLIRY